MRIPLFLIVTILFFAAGAQVTGEEEKNGSKQSPDNKGVGRDQDDIGQLNGYRFIRIDDREREDLLDLIIVSLDYYLERMIDVSEDRMIVRKTEEDVMDDLRGIVEDIDGRYDYHVDEKFPGFSQSVKDKAQSIMHLKWNILPESEENGTEEEQRAITKKFVNLQIEQLKDNCHQELMTYIGRHVYRKVEQEAIRMNAPGVDQAWSGLEFAEVVAPLVPYDFRIFKQEVIDIGIYQRPELADVRSADGQSISIDSIMRVNIHRMNALGEELIRLEKQMAELRDQGYPNSYPADSVSRASLTTPNLEEGYDSPEEKSLRSESASLELYIFRFEKNSDVLSYSDKIKLVDVAIRMRADPEIEVTITGYADRSGTPTLNAQISKARADAVREFLGTKFISSERMTVTHLSDSQSDSENADDRKVEVELHIAR